MKFTRRHFMVGIAGVGASSVLAGLYVTQKHYRAAEDPDEEPEPEVIAQTLEQSLLAQRLVGIWSFNVLHGAELFELPEGRLTLLLDVGPGGRALNGYLGLSPFDGTGFQLYGELNVEHWPKMRWKLIDASGNAFECAVAFDEIWDGWSNGGGRATLSGTGRSAGIQPGYTAPITEFLADRQPWIEARQRLTYTPAFRTWLVSPGHRLFHQLWHASRDKWHTLTEDNRQDLRALDWQPGIAGKERDARGKFRHRNGSGEDFLFMHRMMLRQARSFQELPSWKNIPPPRPALGYSPQAFADYQNNIDGFSVPPAWEAEDDAEFNRWLRDVKSSEGYYSNFQLWEAQYQSPDYLSTLCLGELGSRIELGLHDWLHMRWSSLCRDPNSGLPMVHDRNPIDFAERWFRPENDYLADPFSSHVNPVFWHFHGWIDDRIEDWFLAHEQTHPGEVVRKVVNGVPWFAEGKWVRITEPWLGPGKAGCGAWMRDNGGGTDQYDIETMKLALRIVFSDEAESSRLHKRVPRRPWYGRHLAPGAAQTT